MTQTLCVKTKQRMTLNHLNIRFMSINMKTACLHYPYECKEIIKFNIFVFMKLFDYSSEWHYFHFSINFSVRER